MSQLIQSLLLQRTEIDISFQYASLILHWNQSKSVLPKQEPQIPGNKKHEKIDHFADPVYYRHLHSSNDDDEVSSSQNSNSIQIQLSIQEIEIDTTRQHIHENQSQRQVNRRECPTRNLLQDVKRSFIAYLAKHFDKQQFDNIPIISRLILKKNSISYKDYQELFNVEQFRPILQVYFAEKQMQRHLKQSRINEKTKQIYLTKIPMFQRAFKARVFNKIN